MLLKTVTLLTLDLRFRKQGLPILFLYLVLSIFSNSQSTAAMPPTPLLIEGRKLFYASVDDKQNIEPAIEIFNRLMESDKYKGRAQVYIGALTALRGKHSLLPHSKWKWANKGLDIMDKGLSMAPDDAEALFIHSSTCFFLPFFFNRGDEAQQNFKHILEVLPEQIDDYNPGLVINMLEFIQQHGKLDDSEQTKLDSLIYRTKDAL